MTKHISVRLPKTLAAQLETLAKNNVRSLSAQIRFLLVQALKEKPNA